MKNSLPLLNLPKLKTELAQRSLSYFAKQAWHVVEPSTEYTHGWHIDAICEHLEAVSSGQIRNLIINIPPRHAKSLLISVFWPVWTWATKPEIRWLFASYADSLAVRDSLKCRRIILSPWYQAQWGEVFQLTGDQNAKTRFENSKTGYRVATGVGGVSTGEGGDIVACLPYETPIVTEQGNIPIGVIVENGLPVNVLTFNHSTEQQEFQPVLRFETHPERSMVEIDLGDRTLTCTEDHPVFIDGKGYVKAGEIQPGDVVVTID